LKIKNLKGGEKLPIYETVFVLDPSLDDKTIQKEIKKVEDLITDNKGEVLRTDKWGKKRFTYPIKKRHEGYYTLVLFEGEGKIPKELERAYKLNESCLRYLTVVSEEEAKPIVSEGKEEKTQEDELTVS
jgi:small subunit ribosomal protein S6